MVPSRLSSQTSAAINKSLLKQTEPGRLEKDSYRFYTVTLGRRSQTMVLNENTKHIQLQPNVITANPSTLAPLCVKLL